MAGCKGLKDVTESSEETDRNKRDSGRTEGGVEESQREIEGEREERCKWLWWRAIGTRPGDINLH